MTTSEQARADAMADAETLRLFMWERYGRSYGRTNFARGAAIGGFVASNMALDRDSWGAVAAAHLIFRAVPGLRGDR